MAVVRWETYKTIECQQGHVEASLQAQVVYATDALPDQPPRVLAHRCSRAMDCIFAGCGNCYWTGENPGHDPFDFAA